MFKSINPRKQGDIGVAAAIYYAVNTGIDVSVPVSEGQRYDLIFDYGTCLSRVQVKTTRVMSPYGVYVASLRTNGGNRSGTQTKRISSEEVDEVFILNDQYEAWIVPSTLLENMNSVSLGEKYSNWKVEMPGGRNRTASP